MLRVFSLINGYILIRSWKVCLFTFNIRKSDGFIFLLAEILIQQIESGGKRTDLIFHYLFFCRFQACLLALIEPVAQLLVDGFIHPVFSLFGAAVFEIAVLLGFAAIVQDVFPDGVNACTFVGRAGHHFRHNARFVGREEVQGRL